MLHWLRRLLRFLAPALTVAGVVVVLLWLMDDWDLRVAFSFEDVLRMFPGH